VKEKRKANEVEVEVVVDFGGNGVGGGCSVRGPLMGAGLPTLPETKQERTARLMVLLIRAIE
jgi:hypothetical protein